MIYRLLFLFLLIFSQGYFLPAYSQANDTLAIENDTLKKEKVKKTKQGITPKKIALMSALLPGLGQVYNKKYWKLPIIYGGGAAIGYWFINSRRNFICYREAYNFRINEDNDGLPFTNEHCGALAEDLSTTNTESIRFDRDAYRKQTELSILLFAGLYTLNIVDAYVDAYLNRFDISEDLSFSVKPFLYQRNYSQFATGLTVNLHIGKCKSAY